MYKIIYRTILILFMMSTGLLAAAIYVDPPPEIDEIKGGPFYDNINERFYKHIYVKDDSGVERIEVTRLFNVFSISTDPPPNIDDTNGDTSIFIYSRPNFVFIKAYYDDLTAPIVIKVKAFDAAGNSVEKTFINPGKWLQKGSGLNLYSLIILSMILIIVSIKNEKIKIRKDRR